jgi:hypothetical protein
MGSLVGVKDCSWRCRFPSIVINKSILNKMHYLIEKKNMTILQDKTNVITLTVNVAPPERSNFIYTVVLGKKTNKTICEHCSPDLRQQ